MCREAVEKRLGAIQDADMMELLASVAKLRVSPTSSEPRAAAAILKEPAPVLQFLNGKRQHTALVWKTRFGL